jgi:hypothetical protein
VDLDPPAGQAFQIEYSRFILVDVSPMARKLYLAAFAALVVLLILGGLYLRHRADKAAANCDTPAPPPVAKPVTPPPNLTGFRLEEGCGAGSPKPAGKAQTR